MHEVALVNQILEIVDQAGRDCGAETILSASVTVGRLMAVEVDNLQFALDALKEQHRVTAETEFFITEEPVQVFCSKCGSAPRLDDWVFVCSVCGEREVQVIAGDSMIVTEIEIAEDESLGGDGFGQGDDSEKCDGAE